METIKDTFPYPCEEVDDLYIAAKVFSSAPFGVFIFKIKAVNNLILVSGNPTAEVMLGENLNAIIGKEFDEIWPASKNTGIKEKFISPLVTGRKCYSEDLFFNEKNLIGTFSVRTFVIQKNCLCVIFEDITIRKEVEEGLRTEIEEFGECVEGFANLMIQILQMLNSEMVSEKEPREILKNILTLIGRHTNYDTVALRLKTYNFPFHRDSTILSEVLSHHKLEIREDLGHLIDHDNCMAIKSDTMCGKVLLGKCPDSPYYTENGSFWTNNFQAASDAEVQECYKAGFKSVCIVPLKFGEDQEKIIGLLQIFDSREDILSLNVVKFFEGMGNSIGITLARKFYQEKIKNNEDRYRSVVETVSSIILILDENGKIIEFNSAAEKAYRTDRKKIIGKNYLDLFVPKKNHEAFFKDIKKVIDGSPIIGFTNAVLVEGKKRIITWNVSDLNYQIQGSSCVVAIGNDITDSVRRKKLLREQESQLRQTEKMDAVGKLAGGIAHNFNNLLMGILGNISLMQLNKDLLNKEQRGFKEIEDNINSAVQMTRQLLGFARSGKYDVRTLNLNEIIKQSIELFSKTKKEISHTLNISEDLWLVDVDRSQLDQVFLNIFINAAHAMPTGGVISITSENIVFTEEDMEIYERPKGNYTKLSITDTGIGIPKENINRIFDPFFTTKEVGSGTGLGLASAYGIIKNHGGLLTVDSKVDIGSTFNIYLPASATQILGYQYNNKKEEVIKGNGELILLVDDEDFVRSSAEMMIKHLNYNVISAPDGETAINVFGTHAGKLKLVILDIIMPSMGGGEVFDNIRKIKPSIPVLLSSGYSINGKAQAIIDRGCEGFIQKPFRLADLSEKISELLKK